MEKGTDIDIKENEVVSENIEEVKEVVTENVEETSTSEEIKKKDQQEKDVKELLEKLEKGQKDL